MVRLASIAAFSWTLAQNNDGKYFFMESNLATDKKASQVNILKTSGKRVTAEITLKREMVQSMRG